MKCGIVILGNGFDLFHKNSTDYNSFIDEIKNNFEDNLWISYFGQQSELDGWVDIENEVKSIIDDFENFRIENKVFHSFFHISIRYVTLFRFLGIRCRNPIVNDNTIHDLIEIMNIKYNEFFIETRLNTELVKKRIIDDFIILQEQLRLYIMRNVSVEDNMHYNTSNTIYSELENYDSLIIINFNYTNTIGFYNHNITNIHIHGDVNHSIALGHNSIHSPDFAILNKQTQQHSYGLNYKYEFIQAIKSIENLKEIDLITLGHSFDSNDHCVFAWLYKYIYSEGIYVSCLKNFYYKNKYNMDFINRLHNIRHFYTDSLDIICSNPLSKFGGFVETTYSRFYEGSINDNYLGTQEFDYFERNNLIKNIELK